MNQLTGYLWRIWSSFVNQRVKAVYKIYVEFNMHLLTQLVYLVDAFDLD